MSPDNFKKILDLDELTPEPAIRSGDTGKQIPCFNSCQLITTLMCTMCSISIFLCSQTSRKCEIENWLACGADGRSVYGHVITKFSEMGRFTYPWCSAGALRARSSAIKTYSLDILPCATIASVFAYFKCIASYCCSRENETWRQYLE